MATSPMSGIVGWLDLAPVGRKTAQASLIRCKLQREWMKSCPALMIRVHLMLLGSCVMAAPLCPARCVVHRLPGAVPREPTRS